MLFHSCRAGSNALPRLRGTLSVDEIWIRTVMCRSEGRARSVSAHHGSMRTESNPQDAHKKPSVVVHACSPMTEAVEESLEYPDQPAYLASSKPLRTPQSHAVLQASRERFTVGRGLQRLHLSKSREKNRGRERRDREAAVEWVVMVGMHLAVAADVGHWRRVTWSLVYHLSPPYPKLVLNSLCS